jgi:hypothetical protein
MATKPEQGSHGRDQPAGRARIASAAPAASANVTTAINTDHARAGVAMT